MDLGWLYDVLTIFSNFFKYFVFGSGDRNGNFQKSQESVECKTCTKKRHGTELSSGKVEDIHTTLPIRDKIVPLSVNYHFTRQCNYRCGFCFHTAKTSFVLPLEEAKKGLKMLREAGIISIILSSSYYYYYYQWASVWVRALFL